MFTRENSLILFHGTGNSFEKFDHTSMERGCESEPNNKFGIWLTGDLISASEYAEIASLREDFPGVFVVEASLDPQRIASEFYNLNDFVEGNISDYDNNDVVSKVFAEALEKYGENFDRGEAFVSAREELVRMGFDAMWIDTGESSILAVFNPDLLCIRDRLTCEEAGMLYEKISESGLMDNPEILAKDFKEPFQEFLEETGRKPRKNKKVSTNP